jgi:hypothetical protein
MKTFTMPKRHHTRVFTSGKFSIALFLLFLSFQVSAETPPELNHLLDRIRVEPPARVPFTEQRKNRLLKEPMVLTGYLAYPEAGRLEKVIETPFREALRVDGDEISIERDGERRRISLRNRKSMRVMLASIEAIMASGSATLESYFDATVSGDAAHWRIELLPRDRRLARQLSRMEVSGGEQVDSIRFEMPDEEWQLLQIRHHEPVDD